MGEIIFALFVIIIFMKNELVEVFQEIFGF